MELSIFAVILCPRLVDANAGKRQESEKQDDPVNQIHSKSYFESFPILD
jgi:hypothetical protein